MVGRVAGFLPVRHAEFIEERLEFGALGFRHLDAHQHTAIGGAMVAVVKQADVPAIAGAGQELSQRPGTLREFESVQDFVFDLRRMSAHHVAHMHLGHLVLAEIGHRVVLLA